MSNTEPRVVFYNRENSSAPALISEVLESSSANGLFESSRAWNNGEIATGSSTSGLFGTPIEGTAQGRYFDINLNALSGFSNRSRFMGLEDADSTTVTATNNTTFTVFRGNTARPNGYLSFDITIWFIANFERFRSSITNDYTLNLQIDILRNVGGSPRSYTDGDSYSTTSRTATTRVLNGQVVIDLTPDNIVESGSANFMTLPVVINLSPDDSDITGFSFDADILEYTLTIVTASGTIPTSERLSMSIAPINNVISTAGGLGNVFTAPFSLGGGTFTGAENERIIRYDVIRTANQVSMRIAFGTIINVPIPSEYNDGTIRMIYNDTVSSTRIIMFHQYVEETFHAVDLPRTVVMIYLIGGEVISQISLTLDANASGIDTVESFRGINSLSRYPYDYDGWERQSITTTEAIFSKNIYKTHHQDFVKSTLKFQSMERRDADIVVRLQRRTNFYISFTGFTETLQHDVPFTNVDLHRVTITKTINPKITSNIFGNGYDFNMEIQTSG